MVNFILIYKKILFNIKIEIYYKTMEVITKNKYNDRHFLDKFPSLQFWNWLDIILLKNVTLKNLVCR